MRERKRKGVRDREKEGERVRERPLRSIITDTKQKIAKRVDCEEKSGTSNK